MIRKMLIFLFPKTMEHTFVQGCEFGFARGLKNGISCARWCHSRIVPGYPMSRARADVIKEIIGYAANNKGSFPTDYFARFEALNEKPGWWPKDAS